MSVYQEKLPSRTGPVLLIVFGALGMVLSPIIAVLIAASSLLSSIDFEALDSMQVLPNPGTTGQLQPGTYSVLPDNVSGTVATGISCTVTDPAGSPIPTETVYDAIVSFTLVSPQAVTIECSRGSSLSLMDGSFMSVVLDNLPTLGGLVLAGFGLSLVGLVMLIAGIVWNVSVGRRRREIMSGGIGSGYGGIGGAGYVRDYESHGLNVYKGQPPAGSDFDPYAAPPPGGQQPYGQQPYGQQPYGQQHPPRNPYGQPLNEPPRYGERIDPYGQ